MAGNETSICEIWGDLSASCLHIIGKKSENIGMPLVIHMYDSAYVADYLWDSWLSDSCKSIITSELYVGNTNMEESDVRKLLRFLCSVHDVGKVTPVFQSVLGNSSVLREYGLEIRDSYERRVRHEMSSEYFLKRSGFSQSISLIVGGHHGITHSKSKVDELEDDPHYIGLFDENWLSIQNEIIEYCIKLSGLDLSKEGMTAGVAAQTLLSGIVIMADWLASNEALFPIISDVDPNSLLKRGSSAIQKIHFPKPWIPSSECSFYNDFGHEPRQFQADVGRICNSLKDVGIIIMEIPMGEGKTEAALYASEIISKNFGQSGIMFSMPTQATSDGVFSRIEGWISRVTRGDPIDHTIFLAHGRSHFNKDYRQLDRIGFGESESHGGPIVNEWFSGSKKGLLSDFVIGTVDNVLKIGLGQKHMVLRHLALSQKIVIIDECHTYDAYMSSYLDLTLSWLGLYHIPVIILSATLSSERRRGLIVSYMKGKYGRRKNLDMSTLSEGYPVITFSDGDRICQHFPTVSRKTMDVTIKRMDSEHLVQNIVNWSLNGGVIGVVVNTVKKAQEVYSQLVTAISDCDVVLIHSAFTSLDRSEKESLIASRACGRVESFRKPMVVIGTQVIEQSLDLDFDLLVSDICPVDLLIQRIGRLHRHDNLRPDSFRIPTCVILDNPEKDLDEGSVAVYGGFHLLNTRRLVGDHISIPGDISMLVERAYSQSEAECIAENDEIYNHAKRENDLKISNMKSRSKTFQIPSPDNMRNISGWVRNPLTDMGDELEGAASVRDMEDSLEVILVQRLSDGLHFLPWVCDGKRIQSDRIGGDTLFDLAGCAVRLPHRLTAGNRLGMIVKELTDRSSVIPGLLIDSLRASDHMLLILDENLETELIGFTLRYSREWGLKIYG